MTLHRDFKKFKSLSDFNKLLIIGLCLFLFLSGIIISYVFYQNYFQPKSVKTPSLLENPPAEQKLATIYTLIADKQIVSVGEKVNISVNLSQTPVQVSDVGILFDPLIFQLGEVKNGQVYDKLTIVNKNKNVDKSQPGYLFVAAHVSATDPKYKTGTIFSFELTALKSTPSAILQFDNKTTGAQRKFENILSKTNSLTINITE